MSVEAHMHTNKYIHVNVYTVSEGDMAPFGKFKAQHLAGQVQLERRLDPDGGAVPPGQEGGMIFHQRHTCDAGHAQAHLAAGSDLRASQGLLQHLTQTWQSTTKVYLRSTNTTRVNLNQCPKPDEHPRLYHWPRLACVDEANAAYWPLGITRLVSGTDPLI